MKNRIDACFEKLKAENKKALVTFITAGDPDMDTTYKKPLDFSAIIFTRSCEVGATRKIV